LSVTLNPGTYGLVFGSNQFGSFGVGIMGTSNAALPGADTFEWNQQRVPGPFAWTDSGGQPPQSTSARFVVYGDFVPEPPSAVVVSSGLLALLLLVSTLKRSQMNLMKNK
jgi:hypothetical protein